MISREELAWAAGFFDGEGYIGARIRWHPDNRMYKRYKRYRGFQGRDITLEVGQKHDFVLERFQNAIGGLGYIKSYIRKEKPFYVFISMSFEEVQAMSAMLWHWLSPIKREQIIETLKIYGDAKCEFWP